jgi:hypothetical protein
MKTGVFPASKAVRMVSAMVQKHEEITTKKVLAYGRSLKAQGDKLQKLSELSHFTKEVALPEAFWQGQGHSSRPIDPRKRKPFNRPLNTPPEDSTFLRAPFFSTSPLYPVTNPPSAAKDPSEIPVFYRGASIQNGVMELKVRVSPDDPTARKDGSVLVQNADASILAAVRPLARGSRSLHLDAVTYCEGTAGFTQLFGADVEGFGLLYLEVGIYAVLLPSARVASSKTIVFTNPSQLNGRPSLAPVTTSKWATPSLDIPLNGTDQEVWIYVTASAVAMLEGIPNHVNFLGSINFSGRPDPLQNNGRIQLEYVKVSER